MTPSKLVSVVTASYNSAKYLPFTLKSALNQTYKNLEIILIDDGSTDNTKEVVKKYTNDKRLKYFYQENLGQTKAKNRGIKEATGDYIAFLDADDVWMPDKLEKQMPLFDKSEKIGVVYSDEKLINEHGTEFKADWEKEYHSGIITNELFIKNFVNFNSTVVKKECFKTVGLFDETLPMSIDWDLWLRISTKYEFAFLNEPTFYYRVWSGQMSHNYNKRFQCVDHIMNKFIDTNPGLLPKSVINAAKADTLTNRGEIKNKVEKKKISAILYYLNAIKHKPDYLKAWKGIVKVILLRA